MKDLASHIMDIVQNSVRANAQNIEITVEEHWSDDLLTITVKDDGDGMDEETLQRVRDPFLPAVQSVKSDSASRYFNKTQSVQGVH